MKQTLTTNQLARELKKDEYASWSYNGALALAEWLEEYERDSGEELELDIVAIRCDWGEWVSLQEWAIDYFGGEDKAKEEFDDMDEEKIREYIQDNGQLIEFDGGIIVSSF